MKIPAFIRNLFGAAVAAHDSLEESDAQIVNIGLNERGGFSIEGGIGNYATAEDAMRIVRLNGQRPRLVLRAAETPPAAPAGAIKYVVAADKHGMECVFLAFPPVCHLELAQMILNTGYGPPLAGGFVSFGDDGKAAVYGRSAGLGIGPRVQDELILGGLYRATPRFIPAGSHLQPA